MARMTKSKGIVVPEVKRGQWLGRFPDDDTKVLAYGYRFYPPGRGNGAFCRAYGTSSIYVYALIETWEPGAPKPTQLHIVPETRVGEARLTREADKIGRRFVDSIVRPALTKHFKKET